MIKTLKNLFKQDKEKFVVPKSVQSVIPIKTIWEDGVFLVGKNKYASVYRYYQQANYMGTPPTLQDFREELLKQNEPEAQEIALAIELFTDGSLNTFAKHTNVDTKSRLICYDILDLGKQLQPIGTAKSAQAAAKASAKTAQKAAQAARATAKASAAAVKTTAKATVSAVKAIIAGTKALIAAIVAGGWVAVIVILVVVLLGCAVSLFGGGENSNAYTPISAEVEAYDPLIRQYASQHGIPEYVELIKAVMMQE